jgi:hypothetical protein
VYKIVIVNRRGEIEEMVEAYILFHTPFLLQWLSGISFSAALTQL